MSKLIDNLIQTGRVKGPKKIAVSWAEDPDVLLALKEAKDLGLAEAVLIGRKDKIVDLMFKIDAENYGFEIVDAETPDRASEMAVELTRNGDTDLVMKGLLKTAVFLKAVLDKQKGLRDDKLLSHVGVFQVDNYAKLIIITDAAINISPGLQEKKQIIENALNVAIKLGIEKPNVASLAAVEVVNPSMIATVEAAALSKMSERGQIKNAVIDGPLALDNAISIEAAVQKGIKSPVAGDVDILLVPNLEAGNILYKSLVYFAGAKNAGIVVGAKTPIIMTSRSDSSESKINSIALGVLLS